MSVIRINQKNYSLQDTRKFLHEKNPLIFEAGTYDLGNRSIGLILKHEYKHVTGEGHVVFKYKGRGAIVLNQPVWFKNLIRIKIRKKFEFHGVNY